MDARTIFFCVIGDPIEHSLSPAMHNAVFKKLGLNCTYAAFRVAPENLGSAIKGMGAMNFGGANVTIPHKVNVIDFLDKLSEEARIIGAVNTIKFGEKLTGYNTDGYGALRALRSSSADPNGKNILILGSGGAARAIAITLALKGEIASLTILGVVKEELRKLVDDINKGTKIRAAGKMMTDETKKEEIAKADILIHCTPVGMHPKTNETLVTRDVLRKGLVVMDIVYNPLETKLLREAKKAGAKTVGGIEMFVNQGAESERIWLGIDAPVELMRRAVLKELKK
ncbi:MAG: shikimate dehydrogenase [Candidatus Hydrothermarchaeota archaeon]|nr:shikimate dehydrogenase [Candidatus Hydrothermarchaeota archaeon]